MNLLINKNQYTIASASNVVKIRMWTDVYKTSMLIHRHIESRAKVLILIK